MEKTTVNTIRINYKTVNKREICIKHFSIFIVFLALFLMSLLLNGLLVHYALYYSFLSTIRVFLPELFLVMLIISMGIKSIKFKIGDLFFILIFIFLCLLSCDSFTKESFLITIRDILIPLIVLFYLSKQKINDYELSKIKSVILWCFRIFSVIGLIMAIIQDIRGWEYTSEYFLGYKAWGINNSIRVVNGWRGLNCLGSTGNSTTFGFYNVIAIIAFLFIAKPKKLDFLFVVLSIFSIYFSGNKTALLLAALVLAYFVVFELIKNRKHSIRILFFLFIVVVVYLIFFVDDSSWNTTLFERFSLWGQLLDWEYLKNVFLPTSLFLFSGKGGTTGITSFWDNSYIFALYSFGLIGFLSFFYCLYIYIKPVWHNRFISALVIFCAISALGTNIFFGRNCFLMAMLFIGLYNAYINSRVKK